MTDRPYASKSFEDLERLFENNNADIDILKSILQELSHRKKNKKVPTLKKKVEVAIAKKGSTNKRSATKKTVKEVAPVTYKSELHKQGKEQPVNVPKEWDSEQRTVIELDEGDTKIVEAGPGAGKTAVACARVAYLIEQCDLEASKIFLISFTRTAVKELRDRIEAFASDSVNVAGLQIFTLDSFTWQVLRGLGDDDSADLMGSYENNIKRFIQQLKEGDDQLVEYLEEFEHVVLDEGQDLVGDRADLALQIISNLEEDCGVTVFADSAQAIYGFTDDTEEHGTHQSLTVVERIMAGEIEGFELKKLINVHRTSDPKLTRLFTEGRERLLDRKESTIEGWKAMKQLITDCSHGTVGRAQEQDLQGKSDHLVLYRTRAEVLMASSFLWSNGVIHKIRMSGIPQRVLPWIGRLLGETDEDFIEYGEFIDLWAERIADEDHTPSQTPEQAWQLLLDNVGDKDQRIKVTRLREILSRDRPPIDFLIDESRLAGPVVGTIHASKGREANQVHLMLPPDRYLEEDPESPYALTASEIAEEERVLFVGSTRAKNTLLIGQGSKMYASRYDKRRTYKKPRNGNNRRLIEIGLNGDIDLTSIADGRLGSDHEHLQSWLWQNATSRVELEARYNPDLQSNVLFAVEDNLAIGLLGSIFNRDLWGIAKAVGKKDGAGNLKPGATIKNIRMVGATTVAIPEAQRDQLEPPWRHSGFMLAPVITGFPMVFFNKWNKG